MIRSVLMWADAYCPTICFRYDHDRTSRQVRHDLLPHSRLQGLLPLCILRFTELTLKIDAASLRSAPPRPSKSLNSIRGRYGPLSPRSGCVWSFTKCIYTANVLCNAASNSSPRWPRLRRTNALLPLAPHRVTTRNHGMAFGLWTVHR